MRIDPVLHGLAILNEDVSLLERDLKSIYEPRSRAAHGAPRQTNEKYVHWLRGHARFLRTTYAIVRLIENESLDVQATKGDIATAVENLVKARVRTGSLTSTW